MALVEGAIRRCSLRLIKSETLSLLPWHPFERAEGEDEMLNISGLCLHAAAEQSESLLPHCHICLQQLCGASGPAVCVCVSERAVIREIFLQASDKPENTTVRTNIWAG